MTTHHTPHTGGTMTLPSIRALRRDLRDYMPETRREKVAMWLRFYWWPTRRWVSKLWAWWDERRYGPVPPLVKDRVAIHFGFVEGVPPCTDGPVCAAHGWELSPLLEPASSNESETLEGVSIGPSDCDRGPAA